ncbi:hypothetical protein Q9966_006921 [Columba livia]|nr:hypothetical protein Q9966_006921 [Columba livia]
MPSVLGRSRDTSWFLPHGCDRAGGKTRAAGVQGSLSSCNIPHVKYEAKFLLILHEEPGVNCVLPISSSTELHSLCLHPQTASSRDISKSSSSAPCPNLKDSSSACSVHGLLGLGGQDKGSSGEDQAMRMMVFTTMVMVIECFCCWGQCCGGSASPSQVPAQDPHSLEMQCPPRQKHYKPKVWDFDEAIGSWRPCFHDAEVMWHCCNEVVTGDMSNGQGWHFPSLTFTQSTQHWKTASSPQTCHGQTRLQGNITPSQTRQLELGRFSVTSPDY